MRLRLLAWRVVEPVYHCALSWALVRLGLMTPPQGDLMATFRGRNACACLIKWLPVYERELLDLGLIKKNIDIFQLIGTAQASAGTHAGGGSFDIGQFTPEQLRIARQMGAATWHRTPAQGFTHHAHGVLKGCPHAADGAKRQVTSCDKGNNGLASNGKDDGPRSGVPFPLRNWSQGISWAKSRQKDRALVVKIRAAKARIGRLRKLRVALKEK